MEKSRRLTVAAECAAIAAIIVAIYFGWQAHQDAQLQNLPPRESPGRLLPMLTPSQTITTPTTTMTKLTPSSHEPAPAYQRVPLILISHWRGTVTNDPYKFIVDLTVKQADLGSSVGPYSVDKPNTGLCTYSTSLLDSGADYIQFAIKSTSSSLWCTPSDVVRVQLQEDGTLYCIHKDGAPKGILMRYAR